MEGRREGPTTMHSQLAARPGSTPRFEGCHTRDGNNAKMERRLEKAPLSRRLPSC